jgi:nitrogenase-associated protein
MASIVFYEKPGCSNNTKQKVLLAAAGHSVWAKNLLTEKWTPMRLRPFFGDLPVSQWFNLSAPRVKSGEVKPEHMSEGEALLQMVRDPLLIRRPLMELGDQCRAGFDQPEVDRWIGLQSWLGDLDLEACQKSHLHQPCSDSPA